MPSVAATAGTAEKAQTSKKKEWKLGQWSPGIHNVENAIFYHFCGRKYVRCSLGYQAWKVAECESGHFIWASNGQYLGLFQMGNFARGKYGHSNNAWGQAKSAYLYYADSGWSPWECKPW